MPGKRYKNLGNGGTENSPLNFKKKDFDNAKMMDYNSNNPMNYNKPMSHRGPGGEGHAAVDEFGTPIPEGFVADAPDYGEAASERYFDASRRVDEALNIAEALNTGDVKANLGNISTDLPSIAGRIVGGSVGNRREDQEKRAARIAELREMSRTNPVGTRDIIRNTIETSRLGDATSDFKRKIDPLREYQKGYFGGQRIDFESRGVAPGRTVYEKMQALKGK